MKVTFFLTKKCNFQIFLQPSSPHKIFVLLLEKQAIRMLKNSQLECWKTANENSVSNLSNVLIGWFWSMSTEPIISAYHHWHCEFEFHSWWGVLDTTLCNKVCQWLMVGLLFSLGTLISSTNKTYCHDIAEI